MAFRISQGLRNKMLGTGGLKELLDGGCIRIFSGAQPLTPETAEAGVLISTIKTSSGTGGLIWGTAASAAISKSADPWSGTCGTEGIAGWFRYYDVADFYGADAAGTAVRFDGDVGVTTGDLKLTSTTVKVSAPVVIDTCQFSIAQNQS
jgi:hypothetical protein